MVPRPYWIERIQAAWRKAPIAWLSGARRAGKTTLAHDLGDDQTLYVNCDLPTTEDQVRDPALFSFRDINRFNSLFEYLLRQSGGQLEVTKTAANY